MNRLTPSSLSNFDRYGFLLLPAAVSVEQLSKLLETIKRAREGMSPRAAGIRHLLRQCLEVRQFAESGVAKNIFTTILNSNSRPVRAILFDKTPASNWYVTWHQDLTIAVIERLEVTGFGPWSVKGGVTHVQPPVSVLESMVSLRIHLDSCSAKNGALEFIPGSHKAGILDSAEISQWRTRHEVVRCPAERGDIIVMRPLVLHSSSISEIPGNRRVLHIEYGPASLPSGLKWAED